MAPRLLQPWYRTSANRLFPNKRIGINGLLILLVGLGLGYAVVEQRSILLPDLKSSGTVLAVVMVAITLALIALVVTDMIGRLEARAEEAMRIHVANLQEQIRLQNLIIADQNSRLQLQASVIAEQGQRITLLSNEHSACQKSVAELALLIAKKADV